MRTERQQPATLRMRGARPAASAGLGVQAVAARHGMARHNPSGSPASPQRQPAGPHLRPLRRLRQPLPLRPHQHAAGVRVRLRLANGLLRHLRRPLQLAQVQGCTCGGSGGAGGRLSSGGSAGQTCGWCASSAAPAGTPLAGWRHRVRSPSSSSWWGSDAPLNPRAATCGRATAPGAAADVTGGGGDANPPHRAATPPHRRALTLGCCCLCRLLHGAGELLQGCPAAGGPRGGAAAAPAPCNGGWALCWRVPAAGSAASCARWHSITDSAAGLLGFRCW